MTARAYQLWVQTVGERKQPRELSIMLHLPAGPATAEHKRRIDDALVTLRQALMQELAKTR